MYAIVRIRGGVNTRPEIRDTLDLLHMNRVNHCAVSRKILTTRNDPEVKDYVPGAR